MKMIMILTYRQTHTHMYIEMKCVALRMSVIVIYEQ